MRRRRWKRSILEDIPTLVMFIVPVLVDCTVLGAILKPM
jgi:hypothetical protein